MVKTKYEIMLIEIMIITFLKAKLTNNQIYFGRKDYLDIIMNLIIIYY